MPTDGKGKEVAGIMKMQGEKGGSTEMRIGGGKGETNGENTI